MSTSNALFCCFQTVLVLTYYRLVDPLPERSNTFWLKFFDKQVDKQINQVLNHFWWRQQWPQTRWRCSVQESNWHCQTRGHRRFLQLHRDRATGRVIMTCFTSQAPGDSLPHPNTQTGTVETTKQAWLRLQQLVLSSKDTFKLRNLWDCCIKRMQKKS